VSDESREYLKWAQGQENLKVVETKIPDTLLPKNCKNASLYDVRVFSKKRGERSFPFLSFPLLFSFFLLFLLTLESSEEDKERFLIG